MSDARDAGALARDIAAREVAPFVAAWGAPDAPGPPPGVRAPFAAAGLLDADLPADVAVEVAWQLGRTGLRAAVQVLSVDPADADPGDLRLAGALSGAADALVEIGLEYARGRVVFGRELSRFPVQRSLFAAAAARSAAAIALCRRAASGADPLDVAAALPVASDAAWVAAETALQVHGGYGYTDDYPVSRMWREVLAVRARTGRGTADVAVGSALGLSG